MFTLGYILPGLEASRLLAKKTERAGVAREQIRKAATTSMWERHIEYSIEGMEVGKCGNKKSASKVILELTREWWARSD